MPLLKIRRIARQLRAGVDGQHHSGASGQTTPARPVEHFGEAGPSGASPGEIFPSAGPHFSHTVLQIRYARGPAPGNFFWGRMKFLGERAGAIPEPSAGNFQELVDKRDRAAIRRKNRFRAGGSDCLLANAIPKPSAGKFLGLADGATARQPWVFFGANKIFIL